MTKLFELLPALYRLKDSSQARSQALLSATEQAQLQELETFHARPLTAGEQQQLDQLKAKAARGPLASLLLLVEEQLAVIAENLDQFYDDQFIETCAPWVIPYLGDLIGYQALNGIAPAVASPRAQVANTISLRRRKGTVPALEQLARDITGWGALGVEFFQVLACTQYVKHLRPQNHYAPDLRRWANNLYLGTGFDRTAHTVDTHRIATGRGRYNLQNIGLFLWSLKAYRLTLSPARPVPAGAPQAGTALCFHFSPLGMDMPLFNNPVSQGADSTSAGPVNIPARLRRRVLCDDLKKGAGAQYYGEGKSLALYAGGQLLTADQIQVCNLSGVNGSWINLPLANSHYAASVDPESGRIAIPPSATGTPSALQASFYYGFNADLGGGEYPRQGTFAVQTAPLRFPDPANPARTLQDLLNDAVNEAANSSEVAVEITDSGVYTASGLSVDIPAGTTIELRAADGARPTLILTAETAASGAPSSVFALNGLVIQSTVHAPAARPSGSPNQLGQLFLTHCTLVPNSKPSLIAETPGLQVIANRSILGGMRILPLATASMTDSIVDATSQTAAAYSALDGSGAGGALTMTGCTVVGTIHTTLLSLVSNCILCAASVSPSVPPVWSDRQQAGCLRFSYLPQGSATPRRFECAEESLQSQPVFFSLQYGDPGYAKLLPSTPDAVRRGAEDGGEMGAFHFVLAPLRENDLRVRLQEYLPVGFECGIIYEN